MKILLLGDESRMRRLLSFGLASPTDEPACVGSTAELARVPGLRDHEVALIDWEMRGADSAALLARLRRLAPAVPVLALAGGPERAAEARAAGAGEVLMKPIDIDEARAALERAVLRPPAPPPEPAPPIPAPLPPDPAPEPLPAPRPPLVAAAGPETDDEANTSVRVTRGSGHGSAAPFVPTRSPLLRRQMAIAAKVAPTEVNVLLLGENGTGKTRLAREIHELSARRDRPFVTVNCPCLQAQLLESELFGHVRGAFTGAVSDTHGLVAAAEGGTLFLDEVGELPPALQPKLLRLLQERRYERVGEARTRAADIRIITATNRDLRAEVAAGRFREDLFYRLNVIAIEMPPLRHRPEDILPTAEHLLAEFGRDLGRVFRGFSAEARTALQRHPRPGNLRELRNCVERAAILCEREVVGLDDLPELDSAAGAPTPQVGDFVTLAALEEAHIRRVVERTGSFMQAARLLGINKTTLYRRRRRADDGTLPFDPELRTALTG